MVDHLVGSEINSKRISHIESCFGISGVPLAIPGRVLVGEGVLMKMCRKGPKKRKTFLFNDILVYGRIIMLNRKYSNQHIIALEEVILEDVPDDDVMKNAWLIKTPNKSFAIYAGSQVEKNEWMDHIQKCVKELLKRTGRKQAGDVAAVWVPDSEAKYCMHCRKNQFSLINRRHHCRKCGLVICASCSKNKFLIPSQSPKPVRVCDTCNRNLVETRLGQSTRSQIKTDVRKMVPSKDGNGNVESWQRDSCLVVNPIDSQISKYSAAESSDTDEGSDKDNGSADGEFANEKPTFYNIDSRRNINQIIY